MLSLHVIGSRKLGGAERFCLRLVDALRERGESVALLTRRGSEVIGQVPAGIGVTASPMRTVWDPWSRRAVSKTVATLRPHIVQTYMGRATRLTHLPAGGTPIHVARLGGYYKLDGYRHAHAWVGNTRGLCDYLIGGGLAEDRVFHIGNFIDIAPPLSDDQRERLRDKWQLPRNAYVLITAGRFVPVKGHQDILDAFARLPEALNDRPVRLLMLGDGILDRSLRDRATKLGVADRVVWTGWQTDPAPFFDIADLVVFASREMETLGNVILEAWAHRKPIVVTRFRGAREITRHGVDAWQVPCEDVAALADGIRRAATERGLAMTLAENGHARVQQGFTRTAIAQQYVDLYRYLLERVSGSA